MRPAQVLADECGLRLKAYKLLHLALTVLFPLSRNVAAM